MAMTDHLYLGGIWAIKPEALERLKAARIPEQMPSAEAIAASGAPRTTRRGSTAVIPIRGIITKEPDIFTYLFGGTATTEVAKELRKAASDPSVSDIHLQVHSPGGFASGVGDLADEIRATRASKPIHAHVEDLGASAAYWLASQATTVSGTNHSDIGSIGVLAVAYDDSELYGNAGVKAHLVTTGGEKGRGGGVHGLPIEKVDLDVIQKSVNAVNDSFVRAVAAGRKMSIADVKALNTGEVWRGAEAKKRGLIDQVLTPAAATSITTSPSASNSPAVAVHGATFTAVSSEGGGAIGMPSNTPAAMEPTEEESSMPDDPTNPPADNPPETRDPGRASDTPPAAPSQPAAPRDDSAILNAIEGLKASFDERIKALEQKETDKQAKALASKKDEAIALGLDEKLVDECASTAEVDRLVAAAKAFAPSGISTRRQPIPQDDETTQHLKALDEGKQKFISSIAIGRPLA